MFVVHQPSCNKILPIPEDAGEVYLALSISDDGTFPVGCPWHVRGQTGHSLKVTLLSFTLMSFDSSVRADSEKIPSAPVSSGSCVGERISVEESSKRIEVANVCESKLRQTDIYLSRSHEITLYSSYPQHEPSHYLLRITGT